MACFPWWHTQFANVPRTTIRKPGCQIGDTTPVLTQKLLTCMGSCAGSSDKGSFSGKGSDGRFGFIPCSLEELRAHAERVLVERGLWRGHLPLSAYALARNMAAEVGSGEKAHQTPEAMMCLALSTLAQAQRRGISVEKLVASDGSGKLSFGRIHGDFNENDSARGLFSCYEVCTRPGRRFTSSSQDPNAMHLLIAAFAVSGQAGRPGSGDNFARGADDQAQARIINPVHAAASRDYWVGPIPGVDPQRFMFMRRRSDVAASSPDGQALIARALQMKAGFGGVEEASCVDAAPDFALGAVGAVFGAAIFGAAVGLLVNKFTGGLSPEAEARWKPVFEHL